MDKRSLHLIEAEGLCLSYDGKDVLCDTSFFVDKGDYLCIVGENGSGKSTLIKAILGLKKPTKGKLSFGKELKKTDIGYLPQVSETQRNFPATVNEVVLSGCLLKGGFCPIYTKKQKAIAKRNMERLGILNIAHSNYGKLSGGQQQRVLLARALCSAEKLLVLDEPTAGLDSSISQEMYKTVKELCDSEGMTVIMITHDAATAAKYANKILHPDRSVKFFGNATEYYSASSENEKGGDNI